MSRRNGWFVVIALSVMSIILMTVHNIALNPSPPHSLKKTADLSSNGNKPTTLAGNQLGRPGFAATKEAKTDLSESVSEGTVKGKSLIIDIARTYQTKALPVRIRLQDQLSRYWDANPPSAAELVALVGDEAMPSELRVYLARTFANRVKMRVYSDEEKESAFSDLRNMVKAEDQDSFFRAELANVLTTIDDSDAAVEAAATLLQADNPEAVQKAVAALTHTTNPKAIEAVYQFVQNHEQLLKDNPAALLSALVPLSTTDKDVTPILNGIIQQIEDFKLYAGAVQCLLHAKPTVAVLESIAQAYAESKRFPRHAEQAEQMCREATKRHERYFEENKEFTTEATRQAIENILQKEGAR